MLRDEPLRRRAVAAASVGVVQLERFAARLLGFEGALAALFEFLDYAALSARADQPFTHALVGGLKFLQAPSLAIECGFEGTKMRIAQPQNRGRVRPRRSCELLHKPTASIAEPLELAPAFVSRAPGHGKLALLLLFDALTLLEQRLETERESGRHTG